MRKTPGGGLALPALITLLGLLAAFVAPAASAAATYDITDVGDARFVSITDSNGRELSGQTVASTNVPVTATIRIDIDDMAALKEGDVVTVGMKARSGSHFSPSLYLSSNLPDYLADRQGRKIFAVKYVSGTVVRLVRTSTPAIGSFSCVYQVSNNIWGDNQSTTSEWHIGKNSVYTFANRPTQSSPCRSNGIYPGMDVSNGIVNLSVWVDNCATMTTVAKNGDTSAIDSVDVVAWFHAMPGTGRITGASLWASGYWVKRAYDENTPGDTYDSRVNMKSLVRDADADVSTFDAAKTNLKPGHYAIRTLSDGSLAVACNHGSRLPGRKNSLQVQDKGDATTLKLLAKTGHIWQNAQFGVFLHFADESVPNRVRVETQSTESAYQTKTLTTKPIEPPVGQGQSAIRYDPNAGDGNAFKKVGDPGTATTTAEAGVFLRQGHTFAGWNTAKDGTGTSYQAGVAIAYPAEGDTLTLYAQWTPITYKVRFDGNKATSGVMDDLTATYDAKAALPANRYARTGYAFAGWNTKPDGSGTAYRDKADVVNLSATRDDVVVLYAQWRGLVTVLPDTGGHATHAPLVVGVAVTAAALALAMIARRHAERHSV